MTQVSEVNEFIQALSKPAEGNLELSINSVGDISVNSETSKGKLTEEEDNEPLDMQALMDKEREEQFDHLAGEDSTAPFRDVSESEYVPKNEENWSLL